MGIEIFKNGITLEKNGEFSAFNEVLIYLFII